MTIAHNLSPIVKFALHYPNNGITFSKGITDCYNPRILCHDCLCYTGTNTPCPVMLSLKAAIAYGITNREELHEMANVYPEILL